MQDSPPPVNNLNLRLLQTFMLVADSLSFRTAAQQTHRSQSAVSTQIKQLEAQLGITLLHRTTRSVQLTAEGREMLAGTQRAMHEVNQGLRKIRESADIKRGRVSVACSPSVASTRLPPILAAFQKDYPQVRISLMEHHSADIFQAVRQGEADFGIGPRAQTPLDDLFFETILEDPVMALVPRSLLANARRTITLDELVTLPLVLHRSGTAMRDMFEQALQSRGLKPESQFQCMQVQTLVAMAVAGLGVAVLPRSALDGVPTASTQVLKLVAPALSRQISIISMRGRAMSPATARLAELVRKLIDDPKATRKAKAPKARAA